MPLDKVIHVRVSEAEVQQAQQQAEILKLSVSEYIRLIITLDAATGIIKRLKEGEGK